MPATTTRPAQGEAAALPKAAKLIAINANQQPKSKGKTMKNKTSKAQEAMNNELTPAQAVELFFGRSPRRVVEPLHRAVEAFNWLGELFQCVAEANAGGDRSGSSCRIHALASLGAYIAADYQVSIIGEQADELQACIEAAQEDGLLWQTAQSGRHAAD